MSTIRTCNHTLPFVPPPHPNHKHSSSFPQTQFQNPQRSSQTMRPQNPKTPPPRSKSKKPMDPAESDVSFSSKNSRQPPLLSNTRTYGIGPTRSGGAGEEGNCCGRERLKRHWVEVAGRVWIPDTWGQEDLLKDWIDCSAFDSSLAGSSIMSARESLMEEVRRANSTRFGIENSC